MKSLRNGYNIIVNEATGPGATQLWLVMLRELFLADPAAFDHREFRLFPAHARSPCDIAVLEYSGVRVWFYGDGRIRMQALTGSCNEALKKIGRDRGLKTDGELA